MCPLTAARGCELRQASPLGECPPGLPEGGTQLREVFGSKGRGPGIAQYGLAPHPPANNETTPF